MVGLGVMVGRGVMVGLGVTVGRGVTVGFVIIVVIGVTVGVGVIITGLKVILFDRIGSRVYSLPASSPIFLGKQIVRLLFFGVFKILRLLQVTS